MFCRYCHVFKIHIELQIILIMSYILSGSGCGILGRTVHVEIRLLQAIVQAVPHISDVVFYFGCGFECNKHIQITVQS